MRQLHHLSPEIIVIGAGIAGASLAFALSHAGRRVLLLERDLAQPDRIVGELLQPGGVAALSKLGLGACLEGIDAVGVEGYCVVSGERRVGVPYPVLDAMAGEGSVRVGLGEKEQLGEGGTAGDGGWERSVDGGAEGYASGYSNGYSNGRTDVCHRKNGNGCANGQMNGDGLGKKAQSKDTSWHVQSLSGKKEGRSFHHGRLISALRQKCLRDAPDLTVLEGTVRDLVYCEHTERVIGVSAAFKLTPNSALDTQSTPAASTVVKKIYAPITIIADGCFSKFRTTRGSRLPAAKTRSHFVGLVLKDVQLPMERHGTVCLTPAGPVLLYQIADEARETRMLVDVKGKLPSVADGRLKVRSLS